MFDLDGTLIDSFAGVEASLVHAFQELGLPAPTMERSMVGISLKDLLRQTAGDAGTGTHVRLEKQFRVHYDSKGYALSVPFPGVESLLRQLTGGGAGVYVCTMKPTYAATRIVALLGWSDLFGDTLGGDSLGRGAATKSSLLRYFLQKNGLAKADTAYIGDYPTDVLAARENGIHSIAVEYGYGSYRELSAAGPDFMCRNVEELSELLLTNERTAN